MLQRCSGRPVVVSHCNAAAATARPTCSTGRRSIAPSAYLSSQQQQSTITIDVEEQESVPAQQPASSRPTPKSVRDSVLSREPIPVVSLRLQDRAPPTLPQPVPILHSSAYLRNSYSNQGEEPTATIQPPSSTGMDSLTNSKTRVIRRQPRPEASVPSSELNALEWALRKADASLDELEANPMPLQKKVYEISRGPVGTATSSAVQVAAKLTVEATIQAAKVAAPFGKWVLSEGTKAAAKLIQVAVVETAKAQSRQQNNNKRR